MTMKPPMNGARKGPVKTITLNRQIAIPRVLLANMSANTAATIYVHISISVRTTKSSHKYLR